METSTTLLLLFSVGLGATASALRMLDLCSNLTLKEWGQKMGILKKKLETSGIDTKRKTVCDCTGPWSNHYLCPQLPILEGSLFTAPQTKTAGSNLSKEVWKQYQKTVSKRDMKSSTPCLQEDSKVADSLLLQQGRALARLIGSLEQSSRYVDQVREY